MTEPERDKPLRVAPASRFSRPDLVSLGLWTALITFALDQTHKWWMLLIYKIEGRGRVSVTPFMDIVYVLNKGISYGMFTGSEKNWQYALAAFAVLAAIGLALWLAKGVETKLLAASVGLIIGGALGNALDRVILGGVADFFSLHAFGFYWYVFNIADVAIVAGVIGMVIDSIKPSKGSENGRAEAEDGTRKGLPDASASKSAHLRRRVGS